MQRDLRSQERNDTYRVLRPAYWRGQFHGGAEAPAHARYMTPLCEAISYGTVYHPSQNLVTDPR